MLTNSLAFCGEEIAAIHLKHSVSLGCLSFWPFQQHIDHHEFYFIVGIGLELEGCSAFQVSFIFTIPETDTWIKLKGCMHTYTLMICGVILTLRINGFALEVEKDNIII